MNSVTPLIAVILFCTFSVPLYASDSDGERLSAQQLLDRYVTVADSIGRQITDAAMDFPMGISSVVIYKVRLKWLLKNKLSVADQQFLLSFFENKIKAGIARTKRITLFTGHDLQPLSIKADDSTLQVKNIASEDQLRSYALKHSIQAVLSPEILISEDRVMVFLNMLDVNSALIWHREFSRTVDDVHIPTPEDRMTEIFALKKVTGHPMNSITATFFSGSIRTGGKDVEGGKYSLSALGYRYADVATIIDPMEIFIDSRVIFNSRCSSPGMVILPGVGFELLSSGSIGRRLVTLDFSGGYYYQFDIKQFYPTYHIGMNIRVSRIFGIGFDAFTINDAMRTGRSYPAGPMFGGNVQVSL